MASQHSRPPRRVRRAVLVALAAVVLPGCDAGEPETVPLRLDRFRQAGVSDVLLNETLLWIFDAELDRMSVTRESVRIEDAQGRPATGRFEVEGRRLRFVPDLPRDPGLRDGGLRPGESYRVELAGFPRPDALRARRGGPLDRTRVDSFRAVEAGRGERVFVDVPQGPAMPLELTTHRITVDEPLTLRIAEPIDPSTLFSTDFDLDRYVPPARGDGTGRFERVPLRVRLSSNGADGAVLELRPAHDGGVGAGFVPGSYHLGVHPARSRLANLAGQRVPAAWVWALGGPVAIEVSPRPEGAALAFVHEDFLDASRLASLPAAEADGTLTVARGALGLRWPAAAGNGADGAVSLAGDETRPTIRATRLGVPAGESARIAAPGAILFSAQGSIEIDGVLVRRTEPSPRTWADGESPREWLERVHAAGLAEPRVPLTHRAGDTFDRWIARARDEGAPWTVLVAGGDLWVRGELRVDGPLVLLAGGWIRASGPVTAAEIWRSPAGGGTALRPEPRPFPIPLAEPELHPFATRLRFAAVGAPIRPPGGVARWDEARIAVIGDGLTVRYLGERDRPGGGVETVGPVDSLAELGDAAAVRILVEYRVEPTPPGTPYRPAALDRIELVYQPLAPRVGAQSSPREAGW